MRIWIVAVCALGAIACSEPGPPEQVGSSDVDAAQNGGGDTPGVNFPDTGVTETAVGVDGEPAPNDVKDAVNCDEEPRPAGCPCAAESECAQPAYCVPSDVGKICAQPCVDTCPDAFACTKVSLTDSDDVFLCLPQFSTLCQPCIDDQDCASSAGGAACRDYGEVGRFCATWCFDGDDCPDGYQCDAEMCVKADGVCDCNALGVALGLKTVCSQGLCTGFRECTEIGLSECDAPESVAEICDGLDNDCDGFADNLGADATCLVENLFGACPGQPVCLGTETVCVGDAAAPEICNGKDDDCDGVADEDFDDCDNDGQSVCVDPDDDNDTIGDATDNCLCAFNPGQEDLDDDGKGDVCDDDIDGDGSLNDDDCQPTDPTIYPGAIELCDGLDNDCDLEVDESLCDDGSPCTLDSCAADGGCINEAQLEGQPCDDKDGCTIDTVCEQGQCAGEPVPCPGPSTECVPIICTSLGPTAFECEAVVAELGDACDDGNICTAGDKCDGFGVCLSGQPAGGLCCKSSLECDDDSPCTVDSCDQETGLCVYEPLADGTPCDGDGSGCTGGDLCSGGQCALGKEVVCPKSGEPCKVAQCEPKGASDFECTLVQAPLGSNCEDGDPCTSGDLCNAVGTCIPGAGKEQCCESPADCDDNNSCTLDTCDAVSAKCVNFPQADGAPCNADNDGCTADDTCQAGGCLAGGPPACESSECVTAMCVSTGANTFECAKDIKPNCCTKSVECNDNNPCTADACNAGTGECSNTALADGMACDADGDGCTQSDSCAAGQCKAGAAVSCPPNLAPCYENVCQSNGADGFSCAPQQQAVGTPCEDGNACTGGDFCSPQGSCTPGAPTMNCCTKSSDCNDGNVCTQDACVIATGVCQFTPKPGGTACSDGDGCTSNDSCQQGVCAGGMAVTCEGAGGPCATGSCVATGADSFMCASMPKQDGDGCDDGLFCTTGEKCQGGFCSGGAPVDCAGLGFGTACAPAFCDEFAKACQGAPAIDGTLCDDGEDCTQADVCQAGQCVGTASTCGEEPISVKFPVATVAGFLIPPAGQGVRLAAVGDGRWVTQWGSYDGPAALRFTNADGSREGEEVSLTETEGSQRRVRIAPRPDGTFMVLFYTGTSSGKCTVDGNGPWDKCTIFNGGWTAHVYDKTGALLHEKLLENFNAVCKSGTCSKKYEWINAVPLAFEDGTWGFIRTARVLSDLTILGELDYTHLEADLDTKAFKRFQDYAWTGKTLDAVVVPDGSDRFLVSQKPTQSSGAVEIQRYLQDGTADFAAPPSIAAISGGISTLRFLPYEDGKFTVIWQEFNAYDIWAQRYFSDGQAVGEKFAVDPIPGGQQYLGDAATFSDGSFVVVYSDDNADGDGWGVRAQRFTEGGANIGGPLLLNTLTDEDQRYPAVAVLDDDDFVASWIDADGTVMTRRFAQDGTPRLGKKEKRANDAANGSQEAPDGARSTSGTLLIAWATSGLTDGEITARVFDGQGNEAKAEAQVNQVTAGKQSDPAVAGGPNRFVVAWTSNGQDGSLDGVYARSFDGMGNAQGDEYRMNETTAGKQNQPAIAMSPGGNTLVAWADGTSDSDVKARVYGPTGQPMTGELALATSTAMTQSYPSVAALPNANAYVAAWRSDAAGHEVLVRKLSELGAGQSDVVSVSESGFLYKDQRAPTVAVTASGRVLVCWEANTLAVDTGWDIVCRLYQYSDLAPLTTSFKPPAYDLGAQRRPDLSVLAGTDFLLSWDTEQVDTTGSAVQYQRIDGQGAAVGPRVVANREWTGNQYKPFATPLGADTFAIGWESEGQDGDLSGVFFRVLPL